MKLRNDYCMCAIVLCITLQKNEKMADALALLRKDCRANTIVNSPALTRHSSNG